MKGPQDPAPSFKASNKIDFELEIGFFVGGPVNELGKSIKVEEAENSIFGIVLLNDWSIRDVQA